MATYQLTFTGGPGTSVTGYPPADCEVGDYGEAVQLVKSGAYAPKGWAIAEPLGKDEIVTDAAAAHFPKVGEPVAVRPRPSRAVATATTTSAPTEGSVS